MSIENDSKISYTDKLLELFAKLMFARRKHSLKELAESLNSTPENIKDLIIKIDGSRLNYISIKEEQRGREKYYGMDLLGDNKLPRFKLTDIEYNTLEMCKAFAQHLLGQDLLKDVSNALDKSHSLLPDKKEVKVNYFAAYRTGTIDYTPYQDAIKTLIEAMDKRKRCKITYQAYNRKEPKTFYINPLIMFTHNETLYVHAQKVKAPGIRKKTPKFAPLLAVHRIKKIEMTAIDSEFPENFDFNKEFNQTFGIMKDDNFTVEIEFTGYATSYISERKWSADQQIVKKHDGGIKLIFSVASEIEVISWILSFGPEAKVLKPSWLKKEIKAIIQNMTNNYLET